MPSNLYQRNGIWYARIQVDGREVRQTLKTKNRREAERKLATFLQETSEYHGTVRKKFDDVMDAYLLDAKPRLKPRTLQRYETSAAMLADRFTGLWWDEITKPAVLQYVIDRKADGASIRTVQRDLTVLSQASEYAIEHGVGGLNPVAQLGKRQFRQKKWRFVRPDKASIEFTINAAYGTLPSLARFLYATGMRLDEAATLQWDQVDLIRQSATLYETKNGRPRAVSLSQRALAVLAGQPYSGPYCFPTRLGGPYKQASTNWHEAKRNAQKKAQQEGRKLTPFRLHDLRHLYAIEYLENGGNLYTLQQQLGHSTIKQTEEYLAFLTPEEAAKAMNAVGTNVGTKAAVSI